jgi:hypothetical protein
MGVRVTGHVALPVARLEELRRALREHPQVPGRFELDEAPKDKAAFRAHRARSAASGLARGDVERHLTVTGLEQ